MTDKERIIREIKRRNVIYYPIDWNLLKIEMLNIISRIEVDIKLNDALKIIEQTVYFAEDIDFLTDIDIERMNTEKVTLFEDQDDFVELFDIIEDINDEHKRID